MKFFAFSLIVIAVVFMFGCSAENPICTTNFCAVGEVFPRSELDAGEAFSEVDIDDSVIFATLADIPPTQSKPSVKSKPLANFISASPAGGEIAANATITFTFDNAPADVTVSAGTVRVAGRTATTAGPFTPGPLALTITWVGGTLTLNYTVTAPDTDPPTVTGSTVKDGDTDVDPEAINTDGRIEIEFSENVVGNVALQTEGGDDVGWLSRVEGNKATLEVVKATEIGYGITYVIKGKVSDAAGNTTDISITFVTMDKK